MNYIQQLNNFLRLSQADARLRPSHVSLYMALFDRWNKSRFEFVFSINRERLMDSSHIGSKDTLLKCLRELHHAGYIRYQPPLSKFASGKVSLVPLAAVTTQTIVPSLFKGDGQTQFEPDAGTTPPEANLTAHSDPKVGLTEANLEADAVPVLGPLLKQINKNLNFGETAAPPKKFQGHPTKSVGLKRAYAPAGDLVNRFFAERGYPPVEARKFFLHYESTDWMTGGHMPVTNWQAAADKWMLNDRSIAKTNPHGNHTIPHSDPGKPKDYSIPF